ncbi:MAG TPA: HD domain-containing phosphohydrolase [Longimicrobiales bacterium]
MTHAAGGPVGAGGSIAAGGAAPQGLGRELLAAAYAAAQSLKLYPLENATVQNAIGELDRTVQRILEREGSIELRLVGDFFFLNDARLRLDLANYATFSFLAGALSRHGIGEVEVAPGVSREEWVAFLSLLLREPGHGDPFERFLARLAESRVLHIRVHARDGAGRRLLDDDQARRAAKHTYVQSVHVAREVLTDARLGRAINMRRVKRAVQSIVDQVLNDETVMLGMTTLRDYDEYTFTHSVNVCILSVIIGQRLGFSRMQLYELGVGALFHDIGKMRMDPAILNKPDALTEEELEEAMQHPTDGLLALFTVRGLAEAPYRAMLVAYEHHMKVDLSGYPRNRRPRQQSLFSRIVAVADGFDAGTSKRSYQPFPATPDAVLREMRDNPSRGYDPLIVKAFINVTGVYPVGTLVILDTFELAVVVGPPADPKRMHQPKVKILADPFGLPLARPEIADLSETDPATGQPRRTIIKTTDPEKYGIRVADYFV